MKSSVKYLFLLAMLHAYASCSVETPTEPQVVISETAAEKELRIIKEREEADLVFGQYILNQMARCNKAKSISDGMKMVITQALVRNANLVFEDNMEHKKGFVNALAIESCFLRFAQSPTGPKGYGQLARATFHESMKLCGVGSVKDDDVWETELNILGSACYFKKILLMDSVDGDPGSAIVGYNQGPGSDAFKTYTKSGYMENLEALKYVGKFSFLTRKTPETQAKNAMSIHDLPKVSPPTVADARSSDNEQ